MKNKLELITQIWELNKKIKDEEILNLSNSIVVSHYLDEHLEKLLDILKNHIKQIKNAKNKTN